MDAKDGVIRWTHDVNLWTDTKIPLTALKVLAIGVAAPALLVFGIEMYQGGGVASAFMLFANVYEIIGGIVLVLFLISYYLVFVPIIHGGGYELEYDMDGRGIRNSQTPKGKKRTMALAFVTFLIGLATKSPTTAGTGLMATRTSMYTEFSKVRSIKAKRRSGIITLRENIATNVIYTEPGQYENVRDYIKSHCEKAVFAEK